LEIGERREPEPEQRRRERRKEPLGERARVGESLRGSRERSSRARERRDERGERLLLLRL
jgi:hypothetical protein